MQSNAVEQFSPDDVVTTVLSFIHSEFSNNPEKIHETFYRLQKETKYKDLLGNFEFIDYSQFHYSPLLERILNRLQESRLLSSRNPDYLFYEVKPDSRKAIESYYLKKGKILHKQRKQLEGIAKELKKELVDAKK